MAASQMSPQQAAAAAAQANSAARQAVLANSIEALQLIFTQQNMTPATQSVVNIPPRNVGLIRGFYVHVGFSATNASGQILTKTNLGPANVLSLVTFNDLSNQQRVNAQGWYLPYLDTARRRNQSFSSELATGIQAANNAGTQQALTGATPAAVDLGVVTTVNALSGALGQPPAAFSGTDTPLNLTANFQSLLATGATATATPIMSCPTIVPASTAIAIDMWYYVPISYTDRDLRGAIYAGVVNSVMNLQLTFNAQNFVAASNQDPTLAVFQSNLNPATALATPLWSVEVYQDFLDQLPFSAQGPILPFQDLSWSYLLNTTFFTAMSQGQDYPIPFPNFRNIQSMHLLYSNGNVVTAPQSGGNDINYLALQSANYTNIFKVSPAMQAIIGRNILHVDQPKGMYYFDFRRKPLSTVQYGNLNLVVNPSLVAGAFTPQFLVGFEQLAQQNQVVGAGSIPGG